MNSSLKALIYLVLFSVLHFLYDLTHWAVLIPFCGTNESVFQHLKMAFWSYLGASAIEYAASKRRIREMEAFWYSRLLATVVVPWLVFLIWYLGPALCGKLERLPVELLWALAVTYISGVMGGVLENRLVGDKPTVSFKVLVVVLAVVSALLYVRFTYKLPCIDLFVDPAGL
ncbi:MAG: DUF6512 family protein [bacterium]|jgi:hypothetical protein|nr:DUF6512 family protein [candidate division KSB1 bacterium]MDH7561488.1 DUF6512 family protein [bacterium]